MNRLWQLLPVEWRIILQEFNALIVGLILFGVGSVAYITLARPDHHVHAGYLPVETLSSFDTSSDAGISIRAVVRLPDGTQVTVSTASLAAAQWFVADTCVEKRQRDSGKVFYRLVAPSNCLS